MKDIFRLYCFSYSVKILKNFATPAKEENFSTQTVDYKMTLIKNVTKLNFFRHINRFAIETDARINLFFILVSLI